jgi:predicted dehydrogenase
MSKNLSRRDALRTLGLGIGATSLGVSATASDTRLPLDFQTNPAHRPLDKAVTAITLGAGSRGNTYGGYSLSAPKELDIVGVAEPITIRNERYAQKHNISDGNRFKTWEDVFKKPKFADAIIITMPDNLHYEPCMKALEMGYHVLLEKPIAPTEQEVRNILAQQKKYGKIVAVCHVLRYAPYFIKLKQMIDSGMVGELVSIQHFEPIEHIHMSHSYVRGNWHNSKETTPIILAKSCHDLDILRWLVGKPCTHIVGMGDLKWFKKENAPEGSTARCFDCKVEKECPYSALKIYKPEGGWNYVFDLPDDKTKHAEAITNYLKTTNYGRCVYRMDNDQCDHYVTSMQFEGGVTASFSMEAFTSYAGRRTRILGAMGDIVGDMTTFTHTDFRTGKSTEYNATMFEEGIYAKHGHGGGDFGLARDWVQAIAQNNPNLLTSTLAASIESHVMGFAAEKSRKEKSVVAVKV